MRPALHRLALAALVTLLVVGAVDTATARPPPDPLCGACGDAFADEAAEHDLDLAVAHSTATVRVSGNGTATWTVRNRLATADAADRLRDDHALFAAVADDAMRDASLLGARITADHVVVLRFRDPDFAWSSTGGVLVSGALTETYGYPTLDGLGADALTVVAPDDMRVDRAPAAIRVSADGRRVSFEVLHEGLLVFTPADSGLAPVWGVLAVATLYAPGFAAGALLLGLPVALFAGAVTAASARWTRTSRRPTAPFLLVGSGVLLAALAVLLDDVLVLGSYALPSPWLGVAFAALGALSATRVLGPSVSYAGTLGLAAAGTLAAWLPAFVSAAAAGDALAGMVALPSTVAVFALLPTGYAAAAGDRRFAAATAVLAAVLAVLPAVGITPAPGAAGASTVTLLVAAFAVAAPLLGVAAIGLPLLVAGATFGAADAPGR